MQTYDEQFERVIDAAEGEGEGFRVLNDQMAEWALGKIREAKAEQEKWEAFYGAKLEQIRKDTQNTIDYMTLLLQRYFDAQRRADPQAGRHRL